MVAPCGQDEVVFALLSVLVGLEDGADIVVLLGVAEIADDGGYSTVVELNGNAKNIFGLLAPQIGVGAGDLADVGVVVGLPADAGRIGSKRLGQISPCLDDRIDKIIALNGFDEGVAVGTLSIEAHMLMGFIILAGTRSRSKRTNLLLDCQTGAEGIFNGGNQIVVGAMQNGILDGSSSGRRRWYHLPSQFPWRYPCL